MRIHRFFFLVLPMVFFFCGCMQEHSLPQTTEALPNASATVSYDLEELRGFFVPHHLDLPGREGMPERILYYDEVNARFPVGQIQISNSDYRYTQYSVKQGGYYYVVWSYAWPTGVSEERPQTPEYSCVMFSAYIGNDDSAGAYSGITAIDRYTILPGVTTMQDVMDRDPYIEYLNYSHGQYTCSILDNSRVLQIRYKYQQDRADRPFCEAMVVVDAKVVQIEDSVSSIRFLLYP